MSIPTPYPQSASPCTDVFDSPDVWLSSPDIAYSSWISSHKLLPTTKEVYISMWAKFTRWLSEQGVSLRDCQAHHISVFLDSSELKKGHRQRYVRLIERVYHHLNSLGLVCHNPGQKAGIEKVGAGQNDPTRFLSIGEREKLCEYLRSMFNPVVNEKEKVEEEKSRKGKEGRAALQWAFVRDAAVAAAMIGGGMKVSEVTRLTVNCTFAPQGMVIPADGNIREHTARLFPVAQEAFDAWRRCRAELEVSADTMFPSALDRRRHDQRVATAAMHPATVYRRIHALLEEAGITGDRACCQTLRNTYAAMLIEEGASDLELAECLGLFVDFSAQRMREYYRQWKESDAAEFAHDLETV